MTSQDALLLVRKDPLSSQEPVDSKATKASLSQLPLELLRSIACSLPKCSAASLALCNHTLRTTLGTQHEHALREPRRWRERVCSLATLQQDSTDVIRCDACWTLKPRIELGPWYHNNHRVKVTGALDFVYSRSSNKTGKDVKVFRLGFLDAQLLINYHRAVSAQSDPTQLLTSRAWLASAQKSIVKQQPTDLCHTQLAKSRIYTLCFEQQDTNSTASPVSTRVKICARVVADEMILKFESRVVVSPNENLEYARMHVPDVCPHTKNLHKFSGLASILRWMLDRMDEPPSAVFRQCDSCHTDFLVEIQNADLDNITILVCAWRNLGSLRCHSDEKWQRQLSYMFQTVDYRGFLRHPASVRDLFEANSIVDKAQEGSEAKHRC